MVQILWQLLKVLVITTGMLLCVERSPGAVYTVGL